METQDEKIGAWQMIDLQACETMEQEHRWLVQWCTHLTGTPDEAEDLAHDTVLVALRQTHKLIEPGERRAWLAVIARYVFWRWRRKQWRTAWRASVLTPDEERADNVAVSEGVEHRELHETLERALRRVPATTRQMVVAHYFQHASYRAIAETTGVSEDAVSMRLSRGRRQLRQILTTEFAGELRAYRTDMTVDAGWTATEVWCGGCGRHRLLARLPPHTETVAFRCPGCHPHRTAVGAAYPLHNRFFARLLGAVRRPEVLLYRAATWAHAYFHEAVRGGRVPCTHCEHDVVLQTASRDDQVPQEYPDWLYLECKACGMTVSSSVQGYLQTLPQVQQFKAHHKRIQMVPGERIEAEGVAAQVTLVHSMTSAAVLEVIAPRRAQDLHYPITVVAGMRKV